MFLFSMQYNITIIPLLWVNNNFYEKLGIDDDKFDEGLTLSLSETHYRLHISDLPFNSNILKTVRVNGTFMSKFLKEYSISFLIISRLIVSESVVL